MSNRSRKTDNLSIFIPITKVDEENRLVYGRLAAEEVDAADEILDYESSKPLFEKWSSDQEAASGGLSKGNVRAMHGSVAAGKLTEFACNDDNKAMEGCAKVVDDAEWTKVLEGVYTGFSIGGKYVKRWQDGGNWRYTARPVEVSLVDSPCIKSATFSVIKSDGSVEDRLFKGVNTMSFQPTNDAILVRATSLAKAAGKEGDGDWLEFSEQAKTELIAEKAEGDDEIGAAPGQGADADKVDNQMQQQASEGAPAEVVPEGEAAKADTPADEVAPGNLEQVWKASDGSTHAKKADAIAHNEKLAKGEITLVLEAVPSAAEPAAEPSLIDQLAALKADLAGVGTEGTITAFDDLPLEERLSKMADFLCDPDTVEKSLYSVQRTANTLRECASLYISVKQEAEREADGSGVPATILEATAKLGEGLIEMAQEEVGELMERLREGNNGEGTQSYCYPDYYCELASRTLGLEKADAVGFFEKAISISGKDQARLQKIHDHSVALGAVCKDAGEDDEEVATADEEVPADPASRAEKLAKAKGLEAENADLKKRLGDAETQIAAAAPLLKGIREELDALKARAMPRTPATHVVGKGDDAGNGGGNGLGSGSLQDQLDSMVQKFGANAMADAFIRIAHQNPQRRGA